MFTHRLLERMGVCVVPYIQAFKMTTLQELHIAKNKLAMLLATELLLQSGIKHCFGTFWGKMWKNRGGSQTLNAETIVKAVSFVSILLPSGTKYWQALIIVFRCAH